MRFLSLALAALATLAGCAGAPQQASTPAPAAGGAPFDVAAKLQAPKDGRKRERAGISAQFHLEMEADEQGPPRAAQIFRARAQREALVRESLATGRAKRAGLQASQWVEIGPSNIGGRVRAIAFDPRNTRRVFAGTASGGLWITEDAGATWHPNFDFLPNLSVTTIVVDPASPATLYLGTGEASAGLVGVGVFKSVDGGLTWRFLESTSTDANADWRFVNRLAIHPAQTQVLLAGVSNLNSQVGGIYRTADGGASWTRVSTMKALDIAFDPNTPSNAVAGLDDGTIAYSRDAGLTWTRSAPLVAAPSGRLNTARAEIAFAKSQPGLVYASVDNAKGEVWKSPDAGATWAKLATPEHLASQGDYDNTIWADPFDANVVIVGGLDLYKSVDGGATFERVSDWRLVPGSPHADHHALASPPDYGPGNAVLWNGNDGGIYRARSVPALNAQSATVDGWTNMNNGLAVTQFYSGAGRTAAGGRVVGGTQDNGSLLLQGNQWRTYRGGDGGFSAVDPFSDDWIYGEYVYLAIHRSSNGGVLSGYICNGITEAYPNEGGTFCGASATKKANFIAPFILDPNNANRLVAGANSLWVTDDAKAAAPAWRAIKAPAPPTDNFINAIAVAEGNPNVAWVGHNNGDVYRSTDAASAAPTWTQAGQGVLPLRRVQRITIDKGNHNRVIVSFTGFSAHNLWETLDGGASWHSITGNLPFAPVFDVKRHPTQANWLYAATSVGVFTSEDGGATWSTTNEGPANIRVRELFWLDDATLGAATYGRGMFKTAVAADGLASYQDIWWAGPQEDGWGMSITQHASGLFVALYVYDAQGKPMWVVMPGGSWSANFSNPPQFVYTGQLYIPTGSPFNAYDTSRFNAGAPVGTASLTFTGTNSSAGTLAYTINGVPGTKSIQRFAFGAPDATPVGTFADIWWGGNAQNGWGVSISQQYRSLFAVWYTYDAAGKVIWYVMPAGAWTAANVYTGTAYRASGSPWVGAAYNPAAFAATPVGTMSFQFAADGRSATMNYVIDGASGSNPIVRFAF